MKNTIAFVMSTNSPLQTDETWIIMKNLRSKSPKTGAHSQTKYLTWAQLVGRKILRKEDYEQVAFSINQEQSMLEMKSEK
jgi:hypothetical protein